MTADQERAAIVREMHAGDLLNLDMLKEAIEVEFIGSLWVKGDSGPMTPYVCETVFGDGLHLLTISTIKQRQNYHVIRVDSRWPASDWHIVGWDGRHDTIGEHIDEVCMAIEEECGSGRPYEPEDELYDAQADADGYGARDPWPAFDDRDGCSWGNIHWPWLMDAIGYSAMINRIADHHKDQGHV